MYVGQSTTRRVEGERGPVVGVEAVPHRQQVVDLVDGLALGVEAVQLDVLERPLDLHPLGLQLGRRTRPACPRSGKAWSTFSPRLMTAFARVS